MLNDLGKGQAKAKAPVIIYKLPRANIGLDGVVTNFRDLVKAAPHQHPHLPPKNLFTTYIKCMTF